MVEFRDTVAQMDSTVFAQLSDPATIDGVAVRGMLSAPWQDPRLGSMRTGIVEPTLIVRDADAVNVALNSPVEVLGKSCVVVRIEPDGTGLVALELREILP